MKRGLSTKEGLGGVPRGHDQREERTMTLWVPVAAGSVELAVILQSRLYFSFRRLQAWRRCLAQEGRGV